MNKEELKELAATLNGIADGKAWEFTGHGTLSDDWFEANNEDPLILSCHFGRRIRLKPWSLPTPPGGMQWHRDDWTEEMLPDGWRPLLSIEHVQEGDEIDHENHDHSRWTKHYGNPWNGCASSLENRVWFQRTKRPIPQPQQPDPYAELKAAHASGKVIQCRINEFDTWDDSSPSWCQPPHCYRIKPQPPPPDPYAELKAAHAAGKVIEYNPDAPNGKWHIVHIPRFNEPLHHYRIKPEQQKVPLGPGDVPPGSAFTATDTLGYCCPVLVDEDGCYFASRDDGQDKTVSWEAMVDGWQINRSIPFTGKWNPEAWEPCYKLIDTP